MTENNLNNLENTETREESDTMGTVLVPANRYWGAQTQRSLHHFSIGNDLMPKSVIRSMAILKKAAALTNRDLGKLDKDLCDLIVQAADEIIDHKLDGEFPLYIYQTGSGTQTNMNVNEVIASRANEISTGIRGGKSPVHPNDHVNMSQSSNDTFPTGMNIAAVEETVRVLLPAVKSLKDELDSRRKEFDPIVKIGRTHLQDAVPLSLGQEFSAYVAQLASSIARIESTLKDLSALAIGGTAVGTGLNAHPEFGYRCAMHISDISGLDFFLQKINLLHLLRMEILFLRMVQLQLLQLIL